jgi:hypothetical protein
MSSLAEDVTWYEQFKQAAEAGSRPNPETNCTVASTEGSNSKLGILSEISKQLLKILRPSGIQVESLPSARTENATSVNYHELNELRATNREFNLKLLEFSRGKLSS